ncbi:MAG: DEAD/DEAH box helicase family protein, partial [Kangiella sp.]|nr:DEAD/DEAH box helicase family protein [Kangiella sp.]
MLDLPEASKERLIKISKAARPLTPNVESNLWDELFKKHHEAKPERSNPKVPNSLNGEPFDVMPHQRTALNSWRANKLRGIMALATGAGKTITAIYGAVKIFEQSKKLFLVIAVPYQNLADQWVDTLALFNISAIRCYGSSAEWTPKLSECVTLYQTGALDFVCAVVVNRTLQSDGFQGILAQVPGKQMLFVGDECHHHSSEKLSKSLPEQAEFRLGLSATPSHYLNDELTQRITSYYGSIVHRYDLEEALKDGVLTPYRYYVELVELTDEEAEEYGELSEQISRLAARRGELNENTSDTQLQLLLFKRARLLGAAANKLSILRQILGEKEPSPLTLFYCGDGRTEDEDTGDVVRQIELTSQILRAEGWKAQHFTSRESRAERQQILENFKVGLIDA